jgi:hypothetical protein
MISEIVFKNEKAVQIENEVIKVIVIPSIGGKLASIYRKDKSFELLFQNKDEKYRKPKLYSAFSEYDASGFDDAFPTIDESKIIFKSREVICPDHGEIWSATFQYEIQGEKLILTYTSLILDYSYKKIFHIEGENVLISYEIENFGEEQFPCIWAMHCLVRCEEDMEIIFPNGTKEVINVLDSKFLGRTGTIHNYPVTLSANGDKFFLNKVMKASSKNYEKYYVNGRLEEGYCGIYYPSKDVNYKVYFNKKKIARAS